MKVKRINIVRPEVDIEFVKPILGRLYFMFILPKCIRVEKMKMYRCGCTTNGGKFISSKGFNVFYICIPKFTFGKA